MDAWVGGLGATGQGVGADELGPEPGHLVTRQARAIGEGAVALRGQHRRGNRIDQQLRVDDWRASGGIDLAGGQGGEVSTRAIAGHGEEVGVDVERFAHCRQRAHGVNGVIARCGESVFWREPVVDTGHRAARVFGQ
ncbi:hypothetical protein D3C72_2020640 [compost metagenome]